jgi:hypothetical protein
MFANVDWFHSIIGSPMVKWLLPVPILAALAPMVWWMFRRTWHELDQEALHFRSQLHVRGGADYRPHLCLVIVTIVLTIHEYYGGRSFYDSELKPILEHFAKGSKFVQLSKYDSLYGYAWWVLARVLGYVAVPVLVWKVCFPRDALLDYGLRTKGFFKHLWIYVVFLAIVLPVMLLVAQQPDFGSYYPFYKLSSRSWADFLIWEAMYCVRLRRSTSRASITRFRPPARPAPIASATARNSSSGASRTSCSRVVARNCTGPCLVCSMPWGLCPPSTTPRLNSHLAPMTATATAS